MTAEEYRQWLENEIKYGRRNASELNSVHVMQTTYDVRRTDAVKPEVVAHRRIQIYDLKEWGSHPGEGQQDYLRRAKIEYTVLWMPGQKKETPKAQTEPAQDPDPEPVEEKKQRGKKQEKDKISLG